MRSFCFCLMSLLAWPMGPICIQADDPSHVEPNHAEAYAELLQAVIEAVLEHHIEPPTRQQMVLGVLRHLCDNDSPGELANLAGSISDIGDKQALYATMGQEIVRRSAKVHFDSEHIDRIDLGWMHEIVPGGVQLSLPKDAEVAQQLAANRYVGIGVQMTGGKSGFVFPNVMENGPAARGGILSGDQLVSIDDMPLGDRVEDVINQLRGPEGSQLRLMVKTNDEKPREVVLRRQVVLIKSVRLDPRAPNQTTAKIDIVNIKASTIHELQEVLEGLPESVTDVVLNLSFDGDFHYFVLFADAILDECTLGELITRGGRRSIRMGDGNVLAGRKLTLELGNRNLQHLLLTYLSMKVMPGDRSAQRRHFAFLANQPVPKDINGSRPQPNAVLLHESVPVLDGKVSVSLATRKFQPRLEE